MPAISNEFFYANIDLLRLLIKDKGVSEGHWILTVAFGFSAMNIGTSPDGEDAGPAGVVAVSGVGIAKVPTPLPFSLDAAVVNPLPKKRASKPKSVENE
jgi:hypothetical protein